MKNIIYVPLDERPCNYNFPLQLSMGTEYNMVLPSESILGDKKKPADCKALWDWLYENVKTAKGAILSIDMLLYGGIVPSRLHNFSAGECLKNMESIKKLKAINPDVSIYAFNLIMRCPQYSSSDEEPDYYGDFGREIFRNGFINHKRELNIAGEEELVELDGIGKKLPENILSDYVNRRSINREVNRGAIDLVREGFIDFLVIPQDDAAPYGYTAIDQQYVREYVSSNSLNSSVYMYPGADEVGCTLLARMINVDKNIKPMVYPRFSSTYGPFVIPNYEDRMLFESIKYQVLCAGGLICSSLDEAGIVLMVNSPGKVMNEAPNQDSRDNSYNVERNITEFVEFADYVVNVKNKPCVIADVAFSNGSDLELINLLKVKKLLYKLAGYAGWNTSGNTLGTCIAQGMIYNVYGSSNNHMDFLVLRFVEDAGYCACVRKKVSEEDLPGLGLDYFNADGQRGRVSEIVKENLKYYIDGNLCYDNYSIEITDCYMPWRRMFEVGLEVKVKY
jgi:hypothetical protein